MPEALVDFHLHTTCSDGAWPPSRLFEEIRARQLEYFCVSDHDTMDAYPVPADLQARSISGLEIDTQSDGQTVHVLAYGAGDFNGELMSRLKQQRENRSVRGQRMVERLNEMGVDLKFEDVLDMAKTSQSVGRPHIARALVLRKYCQSIQAAFDDYLAEGSGGYVPLERLSTIEAIDLVHEAGAIAVLAHPRRLRDQSKLPEMCKLFDGIEVIHPSADRDYARQLFDLADSGSKVATGGTDFHARPDDGSIGISLARSRLNKLIDKLHA